MKPFTVKDFNGGMIDDFDDCAPRYSQRMRNMLLDPAGKPFQRNGAALWTGPMPTSEKIGGIKIVKNVSLPTDYAQWAGMVYSHRKVWVSTDGDISQTTGPTTWAEVTGAGGGSIAQNVSVNTRAKIQELNNHVYLSFQNRDVYTDSRFHPRPRKVYPSLGAGNAWFASNMGMQAYSNQGFIFAFSNTGGGAGVPQGNYLYYYVWKFVYQVLGVTYVVFGAPSAPQEFDNAFEPGYGGTVSINGGVAFPSSLIAGVNYNDIYPLLVPGGVNGGLYCSVYRTQMNQQTPRFVMDIPYAVAATANFSDSVLDANLGAPLYTADGSAAYDEPPPCKIFHAVGDYGYYGGFDIANSNGTQNFPTGFMGAIQSAPAVQESAPGSFTIASPDHLTAIESVDQYPIFFWRRGCARVEGTIDSYGNGSPVLRMISEKAGALRQSGVCRTDRGLLFCAEDGIYFTDGFAVKKLTDHLNKFYRQWWMTGDPSSVDDIAMAYHPSSKRYFVGTRLEAAPVNTVAAPNTLVTGDLTHQTDEGGAATTYLDGEPNLSTLGYSFLPTAMDVYRDTLLMGDFNGAVQAIRLDPPTADTVVTADAGVDGSVAQANWVPSPVVWDYVSPAFDFGARFTKKWVTRLYVSFKIRFQQTAIYAQVFSYNNETFRGDAANTGLELNPVRETAIPANQRFWEVWRRFRKGGVRCNTKQVRIKKGYLIIAASKPGGVQTAGTVTVDPTGKTALLSTGAWPANILGQKLFLGADAYATGYTIKAATADTLTLLDPGAHLQAGAGVQWEIQGYPLDQGVSLDSYSIIYGDLTPGAEPAYPGSAGGNA